MGIFSDGWWIFSQGLDGLIYFWYVTLILVLMLCLSIYLMYRKKIKFPKKRLYFLLYPLFLPVIISLLGSIFYDTQYAGIGYLPVFLFFSDFIYSAILIYKFKDYRLFLFSFFGLLIWLTFWVLFVAGMSIANDWM